MRNSTVELSRGASLNAVCREIRRHETVITSWHRGGFIRVTIKAWSGRYGNRVRFVELEEMIKAYRFRLLGMNRSSVRIMVSPKRLADLTTMLDAYYTITKVNE